MRLRTIPKELKIRLLNLEVLALFTIMYNVLVLTEIFQSQPTI